jgi:hypothetical protein
VTGCQVEIAVHDTTRFEWRVLLPLPSLRGMRYTVESEFELPSPPMSGRSPWDQLRGISRLEEAGSSAILPVTADGVRHGVLLLVQKLRQAREGFWRHCRVAVADSAGARDLVTEPFVVTWLDAALASLLLARRQLARALPDEPPELTRERALADEFISVRTFDLLAEEQAAVDAVLRPLAATDERIATAVAALDQRFSTALDNELAYRRKSGYPVADPESPSSLEQYVERAGRLKKHFEALLVLDRETRPIDTSLSAWLASLVAILAGGFAFALQLLVEQASPQSRFRSGLLLLVILAGVIYAARERLKHVAMTWLTGGVYRLYAQRVVRWSLPGDASKAPRVVGYAREWCNELTRTRRDPLNPESGASLRTTIVSHVHKGVIRAQPEMTAAGVQRIRQLFRYDLSPLFPQLHDPLKRVPVVDPGTGRSTFVAAPRRYQIPFRVVLNAQGQRFSAEATLVVDKMGISRLEVVGREGPSPR